MTYRKTVEWMFSQLPMYQRQGQTAFKKDLTNIIAFTEELGNPHRDFRSIHVGGTNGKGSTSHMLASILQEAGYRVGLYTSPHLKSFTERIRISGEQINEQYIVDFIAQHRSFLEKQKLSFFEMTVALAFDFFAKSNIDIAVVEVGMGGRLDSTNIITPEISVITNIGYDHMQFLGETLPEIAYEKAGIIKKNVPVVIGERQAEVETVFTQKAAEQESEIFFASDFHQDYDTDLLGDYQKKNANTAMHAISKLKGYRVRQKDIQQGLLQVVSNTNLMGRWQILNENPKVICDTAHNKEGITYVMEQLLRQNYQQLHIVLGVVNDKNLDQILCLFPKEATYYFCKPNIPRGLDENELKNKAEVFLLNGSAYSTVREAYQEACKKLAKQDVLFVGGSTFVVAEIL